MGVEKVQKTELMVHKSLIIINRDMVLNFFDLIESQKKNEILSQTTIKNIYLSQTISVWDTFLYIKMTCVYIFAQR